MITPAERLRDYGAGLRGRGEDARIVGIDIARGLAVLGMFGAHVGVQQPFDWLEPSTWSDVINGRSSILFAVLAGVSIAIISGRTQPFDGVPLVKARVRILARAALIFAIGAVLEMLGTPVAVILPYYAVLFVLSLPFLRWPSRWLFLLAGMLAVAMPLVVYLPRQTEQAVGYGTGQVFIDLLITGYYPCLVWIAFLLAGLGLGRLRLAAIGVQWRMLVIGIALAVVGYGAAAITAPLVDPGSRWADLFTSEPHSGSPFEVVGSGGFAIAVIALSLLASRTLLRWVLLPVAAVGAMALTAYSLQIVALSSIVQASDLGPSSLGFEPDNLLWLWFVLAALVGCTTWFLLAGKGPLERFLSWVANWAAGAPPQRPADAPRPDALAEAVLARHDTVDVSAADKVDPATKEQ